VINWGRKGLNPDETVLRAVQMVNRRVINQVRKRWGMV
jgi:hypothetical protein